MSIRSVMSSSNYDSIFGKNRCTHPAHCTYTYSNDSGILCFKCGKVLNEAESAEVSSELPGLEVGAVAECTHPIVNIAADGSRICEICRKDLPSNE